MKKLLIATKNPAKFSDIKSSLIDLPFQFVSLNDIGIEDDVSETGKTFEENARKKALFYANKSGLITVSDDGGVEIDALGGEPGVKTRRWIDNKEESDDRLLKYTLVRMHEVPEEKRGAQLRAIICVVTPRGDTCMVEGVMRGIIAKKPYKEYKEGFPFDALLYIPKYKKYYYELKYLDKNPTNHRTIALKKLHPILKKMIKVVK